METNQSNWLRLVFASVVVQYFLALLTIAITTGILLLFRDVLGLPIVALLFLLPVGLSTAFWGLGPGIVSALCAFLTLNYFFISPYYSLRVHHTQDLLMLVIFLIVAVVISQLVGRTKASLAEARAREREAVWLYELSTALAGLNDDKAIANTLAEQVLLTFQAGNVQVSLEATGLGAPPVIRLPANVTTPTQKPAVIVPLQTARGLLGEICLWRNDPPVKSSEERLLRTFASQGALALERARLAQAETRARILEESDHLKSALLSSVSHELRTPLATIKASVTSLRSDELLWDTEARQELLAGMEEETDHLNQLVGNLLDMSRIEAGVLEPQRKWNVLAEIVGSVVSRMQQEAQRNRRHRRHRIVNEVSDELPLIPVDYVQIERVFTNLISNSIKYSPEDTSVTIRARQLDGQSLIVQVSNQGPPVPEEHLDRIFDKFYRVTAADQITGTGLGLSICKGFVEAHGGRIWAENLPDGFAFNFTLPLTWEGKPLQLPDEL